MTIADLIKEFIETSKERLKTPISGAFLWSFLIYNWRPIALLFFSNASIEDKIVVINHKYCSIWAIIIPIVIALIYTIFIPMLMVKIDKLLIKTKNSRVDNIYEFKKHDIIKKIDFADKEKELSDKRTGNKKIDDLLSEIESLKKSYEVTKQADKNTIDDLNLKLNDANEASSSRGRISKQFDVILEQKLSQMKEEEDEDTRALIQEIANNLNLNDVLALKEIKDPKKIDSPRINRADTDLINKLIDNGVLIKSNNSNGTVSISLTELGHKVKDLFGFINN